MTTLNDDKLQGVQSRPSAPEPLRDLSLTDSFRAATLAGSLLALAGAYPREIALAALKLALERTEG